MRFLIIAILLLLATAMGTYYLVSEPGLVSIQYANKLYTIELTYFLLYAIAIFVLTIGFLWLVSRVFNWRKYLRKYRNRQHSEKSRRGLVGGLLDIAEGNWSRAEKNLTSSAQKSDTPILHYLAAAYAAQNANETEKRDDHLRLASEADESAHLAIGMTQARLQLDQEQNEEALATLKDLISKSPKHKGANHLYAKSLCRLQEWEQLSDVLPKLKNNGLTTDKELTSMQEDCLHGLFLKAQNTADTNALDKAWSKVPKDWKKQPQWLLAYSKGLALTEQSTTAERLLRKQADVLINDKDLLALYSGLDSVDPQTRISLLEKHANNAPDNAELIGAIGTVTAQAKLWGKSKSLLTQSLAIKANADHYKQLAEVCIQLDEHDQAIDAYRKCLAMDT